MTEFGPVATRELEEAAAPPPAWMEASERLSRAVTYWLATSHPTSRPQIRPLLALWIEGALYFSASPSSRKAQNLAGEERCSLSATCDDLDIVVEGTAVRVREATILQRVADAYQEKYEWPVTVRDGALYADDSAPTAGPPPYETYMVSPVTVFSFRTTERFGSARWDFSRPD